MFRRSDDPTDTSLTRTRVMIGVVAFGLVAPLAIAGGGGGDGGKGGGKGGGAGGPGGGGGSDGGPQIQLPTSLEDFQSLGTQPSTDPYEIAPVVSSISCSFCHGDYDLQAAPYDTWVTSLMAQSARDPVFHATFTIANQDADKAGAFCIKCHIPANHYRGGGDQAEIPFFSEEDMDGINCNFCHRVVDPAGTAVGYPGDPVDPDGPILADLLASGHMPVSVGNAQVVLDPADSRRGPYDDVPANYHGVDQFGNMIPIITSPYHRDSAFCGTCHEVSNPVFVMDTAGETGEITPMGLPHPTQDMADMVPEQRTYSEWLNSDFASGGVVFPDGRFGGALPDELPVSSCQDCHMPDQVGGACGFYTGPPFFERDDVGAHSFAGGNTWVLNAIVEDLGDDASFYGLTTDRVDAANARTEQMLRDASDMELSIEGDDLKVRVVNQSGHSLPTGYPEGRRMWINVQFLDDSGDLIAEDGAYDFATATLEESSTTKIYEKLMGMSQEVADATNLKAGKSLHLALNNMVLFDNRIPPRGFNNATFAAFGGAPVDYSYADGQYWDDTLYQIPAGASQAVATLYFQTSSREYMEFLRDTNVTDDFGQKAYDLWESNGKSAPVAMDTMSIDIETTIPGDLNGDGTVDGADFGLLLVAWGPCAGCPADLNGDGVVGGADIGLMLVNWG